MWSGRHVLLFLLLQAAVAAGVLFLSDSYKPDAVVETAADVPAGEAEAPVPAPAAKTDEVSVVEKSNEDDAEEPVPPPAAQAEPTDQDPAPAPAAVAPPADVLPETVPPAAPEPAAASEARDETESAPVSTALTAIPEPIPSEPQPPSETLPRLPGEVFRDCAECPELVVIVAPSASETAAVGDGATESVEAASFEGGPRPFAIGRFEITFAEWDACVSGGGCQNTPSDEGWGRSALPVINVSHADIEGQYLPWLSRRAGARYRLPTAAEWEQAAGDAGAASDGSACETRNAAADGSCDDGFEFTSPAGALKPNAAGIFDMHGNVWEWVADCWTPGFSDTAQNEPESCEQRKLRGGSWSSTPTVMADGGRGWETATRKRNSIGFRVVRDLP